MTTRKAPVGCEECRYLYWSGKRPQCNVFTEIRPKGWINEDGTCQAYRTGPEEKLPYEY